MKINEAVAAIGVNVEERFTAWSKKPFCDQKKTQQKSSGDGPYVHLLQSTAGVWKGCLKNISSFGQTQLWAWRRGSEIRFWEIWEL